MKHFPLTDLDFEIQFLFFIFGNKIADSLARTTTFIQFPPNNLFPCSDFCPILKFYINQLGLKSYKTHYILLLGIEV